MIKNCGVCGSEFAASRMSTKYCSKRCARVAQRRKKTELALKELESVELSTVQELKNISSRKAILTINDLQELFGVSRSTVYNYLRTGIIKSVRIGGKTYVRMSDIDALFDNAPAYQVRTYKKKSEYK